MRNNPIRFTDPSGHRLDDGRNEGGGGGICIICDDEEPDTWEIPGVITIDKTPPNDDIWEELSELFQDNPIVISDNLSDESIIGAIQCMVYIVEGGTRAKNPCDREYPNVYYTYEGNPTLLISLSIDLGGMVVDGATILAAFGVPVAGPLIAAETQAGMTSLEVAWSTFMQSSGQYDALYNVSSSQVYDANIARISDSQAIVPYAGFSSSFWGATMNLPLILKRHEQKSPFWDDHPIDSP